MGNSFSVIVNPSFDFQTRTRIGNDVISYIKERSRKGRGVGNSPFKGTDGNNKYSKAYKAHGDFKTAGKTGQSTVNLTLTGDMLDSIEILDASLAGRIVIGFEDGEQSDKSVWMREKGYDFLGLSDAETKEIVSRYSLPQTNVNIDRSFAAGLIRSILGIR